MRANVCGPQLSVHSQGLRAKILKLFKFYQLSGNLGRYVQGQFIFQPGHFGCDSVWYTHLPVHQRLRDTSARPGISRGLKAIKGWLDRFGVSNRKDMFVYKESSGSGSGSGSVFYFR